jgi:hypothetical protein
VATLKKLYTHEIMRRIISFLSLILFFLGNLSAQETPAKENNYRLIISFASAGSGIDVKTNEKVMAFITKHPQKPAFEAFKWGREGEVDYCLHLKELSPSKQKTFVKNVKKLIKGKELVLLLENQDYVKKGK